MSQEIDSAKKSDPRVQKMQDLITKLKAQEIEKRVNEKQMQRKLAKMESKLNESGEKEPQVDTSQLIWGKKAKASIREENYTAAKQSKSKRKVAPADVMPEQDDLDEIDSNLAEEPNVDE